MMSSHQHHSNSHPFPTTNTTTSEKSIRLGTASPSSISSDGSLVPGASANATSAGMGGGAGSASTSNGGPGRPRRSSRRLRTPRSSSTSAASAGSASSSATPSPSPSPSASPLLGASSLDNSPSTFYAPLTRSSLAPPAATKDRSSLASTSPAQSPILLDDYYSNGDDGEEEGEVEGGRPLSVLYVAAVIPPSDSFNEALYRTTAPLSLKVPRPSSSSRRDHDEHRASSTASGAVTPTTSGSRGSVMSRERDVQDSLNRLEGGAFSRGSHGPTTPIVSAFPTYSSRPLSAPSSPRRSHDTSSSAGSRRNSPLIGAISPRDSATRISNSTQHMRDLAKGKRRLTDGTQSSQSYGGRNSRASIATLASVVSSAGESIYEDAMEGEWTSVDDGERETEDENEDVIDPSCSVPNEDAFLSAHPELPNSWSTSSAVASPPELNDRRFPPPSDANPPIGLGFQRRVSSDSARSLAERRASLHAEYGSVSHQPKRLSLTAPGPTVIPLRRYSAAPTPRGATPDPISPRGLPIDQLESPGSEAASVGSRRSSFLPKPLVLTPARTLVAPLIANGLPTAVRSSVSPPPGAISARRRSSDLYSQSGNFNFSRRSSYEASNSGGRISPMLNGQQRRRSSIGYIDSRRDSIISNGGPQPPMSAPSSNGAFGTKWTERRKRSTSEDTGQTRTTESYGLASRHTNLGESPDSSVSGWSDERDKVASVLTGGQTPHAGSSGSGTSEQGSPLLSGKEWENEYYRRTTTPLDVVAEIPDVDAQMPKKKQYRDVPYHNLATPSIELSQASPTRPLIHDVPRRSSEDDGRLSPSFTEADSEPPTPPPSFPLPGLPVGGDASTSQSPNLRRDSSEPSPIVPRPPRMDSRGARGLSVYDENWDGSMVAAQSSPSTLGDGTNSPINSLQPSPRFSSSPRFQSREPSSRRYDATAFVMGEADEERRMITPSEKETSPDRRASTGGLREHVPISIRPAKTTDTAKQTVSKRLSMTFQRRGKDLNLDTTAEPPMSDTSRPPSGMSEKFLRNRNSMTLNNKSSRGSFESSSTTRKPLGLTIWPPPDDGRTRTITAGPRLVHSTDSSEGDTSPPMVEKDPTRPSNWGTHERSRTKRPLTASSALSDSSVHYPFPGRKSVVLLEPRDPRIRPRASPDMFLEALMTSEPPGFQGHGSSHGGSFDSSAHSGSLGAVDPAARWSHYSNGTVGSAVTQRTMSSGGNPFPSANSSSQTSPVLQQQSNLAPEDPIKNKKRPITRFLTGFTRKSSRPTSLVSNVSSGAGAGAPRVRKPISIAPKGEAGAVPLPRSNSGAPMIKKPITIAPRSASPAMSTRPRSPPVPKIAADGSLSPDTFARFPPGTAAVTYPHNPPPLAPSASDLRRPLSTIDSRPESLISASPSPSGAYIPSFRSVSPLFSDANVMVPVDHGASIQYQEELRSSTPVSHEPYAEEIRNAAATPSAKSSMDDLRGTPRNFALPPGLAPPLPSGAAAAIAAASPKGQREGRAAPPAPIDVARSLASISSDSSLISPTSLRPSDRARSPVSISASQEGSRASSIVSTSHSSTGRSAAAKMRAGRRTPASIRGRRDDSDEYEGYQQVRQGPIGVRDVFRAQLLER